MSTEAEDIASRLSRYLRSSGPIEVQEAQRITAGHVRDTWRVRLSDPEGDHTDAVLSLGGGEYPEGSLYREREHALLNRLHDEGFPVPRVLASSDDPTWFGSGFLLMDYVSGVTSPRPLLSERGFGGGKLSFARQLAQLLADLHASPAVAALPPERGNGAELEVSRWEGALRTLGPPYETVLDEAVDWLRETTIVGSEHGVLVHGDYRLGNFVYDRNGIIAVLDWESAHRGDPLEDLAWATISLWRYGTDWAMGLVPIEEWWSLYEAASSQGGIDRTALRFWRVLCALKMAVWLHRVYRRTADEEQRHDQARTRQALVGEIETWIATPL